MARQVVEAFSVTRADEDNNNEATNLANHMTLLRFW